MLKPCPCCTHDAALIPVPFPKSVRFKVQCENDGCGLSTNSFGSEAEATAAWNERPEPAADLVEFVARAIWNSNFHPSDVASGEAQRRIADWPEDWSKAKRQARAAILALKDKP